MFLTQSLIICEFTQILKKNNTVWVLLNVNFAIMHVCGSERENKWHCLNNICLMADNKTNNYYYINLTNMFSLHGKTHSDLAIQLNKT